MPVRGLTDSDAFLAALPQALARGAARVASGGASWGAAWGAAQNMAQHKARGAAQNMARGLAQGVQGASRVLPALRAAAQSSAEFSTLFRVANVESGLDPQARAKGSTATGLFQFVESTWLQLVQKHGRAIGLPAMPRAETLALRNDPAIASLMAARHMDDNRAILEGKLGRKADDVDLYLAHFLGAQGATRFLGAMAAAPGAYGAALFPAAARSNPAVFYAGGVPRSLAEIHDFFAAKLAGAAPAAEATPGAAPAVSAASAAMRVALAAVLDGLGPDGLGQDGRGRASGLLEEAGFGGRPNGMGPDGMGIAGASGAPGFSLLSASSGFAGFPGASSGAARTGAAGVPAALAAALAGMDGAPATAAAATGLFGDGAVGANAIATAASTAKPHDAARLAYLLLADMGG